MGKKGNYKRTPRFTKRLEATFSANGLSFKGILSNLSETGLFIRTNRGFIPNTIVDIEIVMPDNKISHLKGIVRRTIKNPVTLSKNGMGIELIEKDEYYINYVRDLYKELGIDQKDTENNTVEFKIINCKNCGIGNKVKLDKINLHPICGRCGASLS